jgi:hypothetical protein
VTKSRDSYDIRNLKLSGKVIVRPGQNASETVKIGESPPEFPFELPFVGDDFALEFSSTDSTLPAAPIFQTVRFP